MCGICAYIGKNDDAINIVFNLLKRLEYRGYDSAGIAYIKDNKIFVHKDVGEVDKIIEAYKIQKSSIQKSNICIGHTRWATHGKVTKENAHPHTDCNNEFAVVHNGIIENYDTIKEMLIKEGHKFKSETDTEVIAHLIEKFYKEGINNNRQITLEEAVRNALSVVNGSYGIAVISTKEEKVVAARLGSPIIIGIGEDGYYVSSDYPALIRYTKNVINLHDNEIAILTKDNYEIKDMKLIPVKKEIFEIKEDLISAEKNGYPTYMLKEIFEQPKVIEETMRGRLLLNEGIARLGGIKMNDDEIRNISRIIIIACGTSLHAGMIGKYVIEELARIPVEVAYASEFKYSSPILNKNTLVIAISQSGETADTLMALREAKNRGAQVMGIVNVVGSSIAREAGRGVYIYAGPEIGVASTKAFTAQMTALYLLAMHFGRARNTISQNMLHEYVREFSKIPEKVKEILDEKNVKKIMKISKKFSKYKNFLFLGRGYNYPIALEGALKLKEISYIHAEGYPSGEMKHGPIAMIDENFPCVFICVDDNVRDKVINNIKEIKARKGKVIIIATEGDKEISKITGKNDEILYVPRTMNIFYPFLTIIYLQLFAYYCAINLGRNVDKPRNLAKSVTVE
ncbi:MAG: glutamine--fructose-6-phosphate transaminase (isomerizing) [Candidatus Altarchaeaceae archaeon]